MQRIPVNDLKRHNGPIAAELDGAIARVCSRGWYILGPELEAFEAEFAAYCGVAHGVGVGNGTDALTLALTAAGVKAGDEVATVANAGMYGTTAIRSIGAVPVYVDVDPATMTMDPKSLENLLAPATAAVIVTHLYGRLADIDILAAIARRHAIPLIEDCAHAHGAERNGKRAGSWGAAAAFSFYPTKNLGALGDAGLVASSDARIADCVRKLRQYGWTSKYHSSLANGFNSRLDEIQAAVLRAKLGHLGAWNARRREIANAYRAALSGTNLQLPAVAGADDVAHFYVIRTDARDTLRACLAAKSIGTDIHYPVPDHCQQSMSEVPFRRTGLPVTEQLSREVLTLPCFPELNDGEVREVASAVRSCGAVLACNAPPNAVLTGNPARITNCVGAREQKAPFTEVPEATGMYPSAVRGVALYRLPRVEDARGQLTFGEARRHVPFEIKRYFLVFGVPSPDVRGEHAHRTLHQFLVCVHGQCNVVVDDGVSRQEFVLDSPATGIHIPPMVWSVQYKYSPNAVMLVLASDPYDAADYIRDYAEFLSLCEGHRPPST